MTSAALYDLLCQIVRVGFVSVRDVAAMRVRVEFADITGGAVVSDWLQVLTRRAKEDKQYDLPDEGDQVLCLFLPFGKECGFVLGSMYGAETPPAASGDTWRRSFKDGTWLEYDRAGHKLAAGVMGEVEVSASGGLKAVAAGKVEVESGSAISLTAPQIFLNGNISGVSSGSAVFNSAGTFVVNAGRVSLNGDQIRLNDDSAAASAACPNGESDA